MSFQEDYSKVIFLNSLLSRIVDPGHRAAIYGCFKDAQMREFVEYQLYNLQRCSFHKPGQKPDFSEEKKDEKDLQSEVKNKMF